MLISVFVYVSLDIEVVENVTLFFFCIKPQDAGRPNFFRFLGTPETGLLERILGVPAKQANGEQAKRATQAKQASNQSKAKQASKASRAKRAMQAKQTSNQGKASNQSKASEQSTQVKQAKQRKPTEVSGNQRKPTDRREESAL